MLVLRFALGVKREEKIMRVLISLALVLLLLSACDKEREAARATGEIPKQTIDNTVNKVNEINAIAEKNLRANTDGEISNTAPEEAK